MTERELKKGRWTVVDHSYKTIKSAKEDGWKESIPAHSYGGKMIIVKDKMLVKDFVLAVSMSAWKAGGFRIRNGENPHATLRHTVGGAKSVSYGVFRDDQVAIAEPYDKLHGRLVKTSNKMANQLRNQMQIKNGYWKYFNRLLFNQHEIILNRKFKE